MKNKNLSFMTQAAMIAAIYVVLTYIFAPFSFGEVQVRISEACSSSSDPVYDADSRSGGSDLLRSSRNDTVHSTE